jgi:hypothetical protein
VNKTPNLAQGSMDIAISSREQVTIRLLKNDFFVSLNEVKIQELSL